MRTERPICAILCALLLVSLGARAADPAAAPSTADSLARIEHETLLLKAQERQMAVRLALAAQHNDLAQRHIETRNLARPARAGDPSVVAVEAIGPRQVATLLLDNGSLLEAAPGDLLPNGMTLLSIRAGEVVAGRGRKERIRLAHAAPPAAPGSGVTGPSPATAARAPWTLPPLAAMPALPVSAIAVQAAPK